MKEENKSKKQLIDELHRLRHRVEKLQSLEAKRKEMENALRVSETQKQAILDASIDRIRHVDKNLRLIWANKTSLEPDMTFADVIGHTCYEVFAERDTPCEGCPNLKARETGQIERAVIHKPKVRGIEGLTYWDVYIVPLKNKSGEIQTYFQIARNITSQKKAENSLRESEEMFRGIFSGSPIGIAIYSANGRLLDVNSAYLDIFAMGADIEKKRFDLFREPYVPEYVKEQLREFRSARYEFTFNFEMTGQMMAYQTTRTGIIYLDVQITPLVHTDHTAFRGYLVQLQDISRRKQAEEHIRNLTHDLLKAQESERQKISRDLHDRVAQDLSTLKIGMDTLFDQEDAVPDKVMQRVSTLGKILQGTIEAVRDLSYELRPPGLDQLGLVRTVFQYCEDFSERSGIGVDFSSAGVDDLKLNFDTEINLYRLVQEGLNNVKKHADAHRVIIRLVASFPNIILRIEDDGKGFDVKTRSVSAANEKRMGIQNMRERVGLLAGTMKLRSSPKSGTKIFIEIPFKEKNDGTEAKYTDHRRPSAF